VNGSEDRTRAEATRRAERQQRIIDVIRALGEGEVTTYGDIAEVAGYPRQSRLVGRILATSPEDLPWWRVVNSVGRLVPGHERTQAALLRAEAVQVASGRVVNAPIGRFHRPQRRLSSSPRPCS
jgi:methylated-DNA-protein-cysteine methyltransferase-like protein